MRVFRTFAQILCNKVDQILAYGNRPTPDGVTDRRAAAEANVADAATFGTHSDLGEAAVQDGGCPDQKLEIAHGRRAPWNKTGGEQAPRRIGASLHPHVYFQNSCADKISAIEVEPEIGGLIQGADKCGLGRNTGKPALA
jgi:hypothetical protein